MPDMQTVLLHLAFLNREISNTYGRGILLYHSQQSYIICSHSNSAANISDQQLVGTGSQFNVPLRRLYSILGEVACPGKPPHWQNTRLSAVKEELSAAVAFQPVLEALGRVAGH